MTHTDDHIALSPPPPPPLPPPAIIAIDTSLLGTTLHLLQQTPHAAAAVRSSRRQSPTTRRARSLSPPRRSPKLRHTNGRLHGDATQRTNGKDDQQQGATAVDATDWEASRQRHEEMLLVCAVEPPRQPTAAARTRSHRPRHESMSFPLRKDVRRSISCAEWGESNAAPPAQTPRRFKIFYRDEALRESCAKNTRRMIENARSSIQQQQPPAAAAAAAVDGGGADAEARGAVASPPPVSNQQRFALKALKYRNLLHRMHEIDDSRLNDPSFDVLECLGVQWCKV